MIKLATIFQDGMMLQRGKELRIWGETDREQSIEVYCGEECWVSAQEIQEGKFSVMLPAREAAENVTVTITGSAGDEITLSNVDIGEIWIAGGQSNMEFFLRYDAEGKKTIANANDDHLRYYNVAQYAFNGEEKDGFKDESRWNKWFPYKPEYIETFSAVGLYFANQLREKLGVPVGIVGCNWGGTTASTWMDEKLLEEDPELRIYIDDYAEKTKDLDLNAYLESNRNQRGSKSDLVDSITRYMMEGSHKLLLKLMNPLICSFPAPPMGPCSENRPGGLYHSMVSKIAGFACRGVLWYQGESDDHHADLYAKLFSAMIGCWRRDWKDELPFLFVQLAPFRKRFAVTAMNYPTLRQKQELVSKTVPNTFMASIMDVGMQWDIHPKKKRPVGERLALLARGKVYGEDILCEAPELESAQRMRDSLILAFRHAGNGLTLSGKTLSAMKIIADGSAVQNWKAEISQNVVKLTAKSIETAKQIQVHYAWEQYCEVNLYNSAKLPAKPFCVDIN